MFMLHDVSVCMGKLEIIFTIPCSLFFINVTESLIVLLIIIKIVLYVVIIKIFYFKKD